ncbi:hypothetical protein IJH06_03150 [Candidatus Saccharibacteria bacterium]|nr:hypothetical protein [Candidatus Saccharibacteria bacterium]
MTLEDKKYSDAMRARIDMIVDAQEMRGNVVPRRRRMFNKKPFVIALSVMGVVIVGLVITILLVVRPWEYYEEGDSRIVRICYYSSKTTEELVECVEKNHGDESILNSYREIIAKRISKLGDCGKMNGAMNAYQDIIDVLDGEDKVNLLMDRIRWILLNDNDDELGETAVADALEVYEMEPGATSANTVVTVAQKYGFSEIEAEYTEIFDGYMMEYEGKGGMG